MYIVQANTTSTTDSQILNKAKTLAANIAAVAFTVGAAVMESGFKIKSGTVEKSTQAYQRSNNSRYQRAPVPEDRSDFGQKIKDALDAKNV